MIEDYLQGCCLSGRIEHERKYESVQRVSLLVLPNENDKNYANFDNLMDNIILLLAYIKYLQFVSVCKNVVNIPVDEKIVSCCTLW